MDPVTENIVLQWGEMGTKLGINRSVARIHGLLFTAAKPLPADEIASTLSLERSNVSAALNELLAWGVVRKAPIPGEPCDQFEALPDVWETFRRILLERKNREFDPTLLLLRKYVEEARSNGNGSLVLSQRRRLSELLDFLEATDRVGGRLTGMTAKSLRRLALMSERVLSLIGGRRSG